ncbi:unnamed protein product, partial [Discosporangium mesarthrocarpum]
EPVLPSSVVSLSIAVERMDEQELGSLAESWEFQLSSVLGVPVQLADWRGRKGTTGKRRDTLGVQGLDNAYVSVVVDFLSRQPQVHWIEERPPLHTANYWA